MNKWKWDWEKFFIVLTIASSGFALGILVSVLFPCGTSAY